MIGDRKKNVVLTLKGDVERLRLEPGDKLVIKFPADMDTSEFYERVKAEAEGLFPGHEIIITCGIDLQVVTS